MDAHDLVSKLKYLATELGRTPTHTDWQNTGEMYQTKKLFGTFTQLLQAAGLDTYSERRTNKVTKEEVYGRDIEQAIADHIPDKRAVNFSGAFEPILDVGDTHFPFTHQETLEKIYRFAEKEKPGYVVQSGDLFDMLSFASFPKSMNVYSPDQELELARKQAEEFWKEIKKAAPNAKCIQIKGNHSLRPMKRILEVAPAFESLVAKSLAPMFEFDGVKTITDYREITYIQGIAFHHGYLTQLGGVRDALLCNSVVGHSHRGGVVFRNIPGAGKIIWELNAGYVGDERSKAFSYTPTKANNWTLGWGFVTQMGKQIVPMFIPA